MAKILIIEDNQIMADNFALILKSFFDIECINSAEEAMNIINKNLPDIIILDVLLNGHSAFALLNELQSYQDTANIPIIICSNLVNHLDMKTIRHYNVHKVIDKSVITPDILINSCREIGANFR